MSRKPLAAKFPNEVFVAKDFSDVDFSVYGTVEGALYMQEEPIYIATYKLVKVRKFRNEAVEMR